MEHTESQRDEDLAEDQFAQFGSAKEEQTMTVDNKILIKKRKTS